MGDESLICVPLRNGAEVIGTLNVMSRDADQRLDDDDREILEMLSVVLSAAVARSAQLDARQEEANALTRFRTRFDGASIGIVRMSRDGAIVEVNPALERDAGNGRLPARRSRLQRAPGHRTSDDGRRAPARDDDRAPRVLRDGGPLPAAQRPADLETSLIGPLTLHVVEMALRQGRAWRDAGLDLTIAVNLSTRNLLDRELPRRLAELLERANMPATSLELEVTESSMLANAKRAKVVLGELSALGIRLSINDFGTGYSSLCCLRELPVDEIKIDRSFVMRMSEEHDDVAIVRSTIDLGRNLGLDVVAEGVEIGEIWDKLQELGCQTAQDYYLSRPVLTEWLRDRVQPALAGAAGGLGDGRWQRPPTTTRRSADRSRPRPSAGPVVGRDE